MELVRQLVQFWDFFRFKCCSRSDFLYIRKNIYLRYRTQDAVLTTLIKLWDFIAYFWLRLLCWQMKFKGITKNLRIISKKSCKERRNESNRNKRKNVFFSNSKPSRNSKNTQKSLKRSSSVRKFNLSSHNRWSKNRNSFKRLNNRKNPKFQTLYSKQNPNRLLRNKLKWTTSSKVSS